MRTVILAAVGFPLLLSAGMVTAADGQEEEKESLSPPEPASASILIEPALAVIGFYEGDVDIALDPNIAVGLWGQYFDYTLGNTGISGYGIGVGAPFFLSGEVFRGAYLYPLVKFQSVSFQVDTVDSVTATFYGPQLTAGYQWTWGRPVGFSLRIGGGIEYSFGQIDSDSVDDSLSFDGLDYELDAAIGASF
jgi:hypothetical protein